MNTYDFDKTVFYPDSSVCFYRFCLRNYPSAVWRTIPASVAMAVRYRSGKADARELKQQLFSFLGSIPDVEAAVAQFWRENEWRLLPWYLKQKREDDLIISASPVFLLKPICDKLGVSLIATEMDPHTGQIRGANCHDTEKVRRFLALYPEGHTEAFYSDSLSDAPMAEIADKAFLVRKNKVLPWPR